LRAGGANCASGASGSHEVSALSARVTGFTLCACGTRSTRYTRATDGNSSCRALRSGGTSHSRGTRRTLFASGTDNARAGSTRCADLAALALRARRTVRAGRTDYARVIFGRWLGLGDLRRAAAGYSIEQRQRADAHDQS
jgi:hypothetical protein